MEDLIQDVRFALRSFVKNPAFTFVIVATLALGIGANAAIFTLLDQILLRALPVADPERLVVLDAPGPDSGSTHNHSETLSPISHPMFQDLRDKNQVFDGVLAHFTTAIHLSSQGQTEQVSGDLVSGTFFDVLGLKPALGRLFGPQDDRVPGAHPVVVLGHGYFTRRFGADPRIVGQSVMVNNHPMTIIGVAPRGFHGIEVGESIDVYVPIMMQPQIIPTWSRGVGHRRVRWLTAMARLKPGVSREQARAGINVLYRQILEDEIQQIETRSERFRAAFVAKQLVPLPGWRGTSELRGQSEITLLVLMGMVALVLLVACANVANLLLARASSRAKEIALRLALGASRARIVRQLLVESTTLAVMGGAIGLLLAAWTGDLLLRALPFEGAARALTAEPDLRVVGFALGLSLVTGVLFGLAPAFHCTSRDLLTTLKNEAGSVMGGGASFRWRKGLVVAQVALSLLLLIGAGLFTRSLRNLERLNPGFDAERLLALTVNPALNGYDMTRRIAVAEQIRQEIAAEPGVKNVSLAREALMTNSNSSSTVMVEGYEAKEGEDMNPNFNAIAPSFFATMGIPLLQGRDFTDGDAAGAPKVAIVNETMARYFFAGKDPIGRRFGLGRGPLDTTIVGVVRDGKAASLKEKPLRFVYTPYMQADFLGEMTFYVRTAADVDTLAGRLRKVVARVDPGLPVSSLKSMRAQIGESLFVERMVAALSAAFGFLATLLAAVGLYGMMSYAVVLRTREIGVRVALGAGRRAVLAMVFQEVAILAGLGIALGLPTGYGLGRLVESQLFGLRSFDPPTFAMASAALAVSAFVAAYAPASRATRVDPIVALRCE